MRVVGVILAGGQSRRFGSPKALAPWRGATLIEHVAQRLSPQVADLAVAGDAGPLKNILSLSDSVFADKGPLAGVAAGLVWAASLGADYLATAPCDVPLLPQNFVSMLLTHANAEHSCSIVPRMGKFSEHACALWPVRRLADVTHRLQNEPPPSLHEMHAILNVIAVDLAPAALTGNFYNVNTKADLTQLSKDESE
ncbi:MAG: molybdenum cofactor guanylyltransferase [Parvibaculum sp.]|nr:molybdenum cofactor guanylyltransferase [Parvibaculum sp.]